MKRVIRKDSIVNAGFTLIELMIVTVITSIIFLLVINLYTKMMETRVEVEARQSLMQNSYYVFERINVLIKDYTIDYEEYFNRRIVGCDGGGGNSFSWSGHDNGYCDNFTSYGNESWDSSNHKLYYCSSEQTEEDNPNYVNKNDNMLTWEGCWDPSDDFSSYNQGPQSFGQYEQQFRDRKEDTDSASGVVNDDDDIDYGSGPVAVPKNEEVQELYLISEDERRRVFLRRKLVGSGDWDRDGITGNGEIDKLYSLQMLKLRGFDAGKDHNFDGTNEGLYDGDIDTRACDFGKGFECNGGEVASSNSTYSGYKLPVNENDGWTNMIGNEVTISDWNIKVYPNKKPGYAWAEDVRQINPYIRVHITTNLYGEPWSWKLNPEVLEDYQMDLQTTFNMRTNY